MKALLFDLPTEASPRLKARTAWIEKHGIKTHWSKLKGDSPCWAIVPLEEDKDRCFADCMAHNARAYSEIVGMGQGKTLDEALLDLARQRKMETWDSPQWQKKEGKP